MNFLNIPLQRDPKMRISMQMTHLIDEVFPRENNESGKAGQGMETDQAKVQIRACSFVLKAINYLFMFQ